MCSKRRAWRRIRPGAASAGGKLYRRTLVIELRERGRKVSRQTRFTVFFKEHDIGTPIPDLIVDELVIVDMMAATTFNESHIAQMTGHLSHTGLRLGLLLNFKHAKLLWKRIVN